MAAPIRSCEVAESLYEFLTIEMVNVIQSTTSDKNHDKVYYRLEMLGFRVGQGLAERYTKDVPRYQSSLDVVKFICKEFWIGIFKKQIDNLRTNHKGVFVLQDSKFKFFQSISNGKQYVEQIHHYTAFPCGLIRGALDNLGLHSTVEAEVHALPSITFKIHISNH